MAAKGWAGPRRRRDEEEEAGWSPRWGKRLELGFACKK